MARICQIGSDDKRWMSCTGLASWEVMLDPRERLLASPAAAAVACYRSANQLVCCSSPPLLTWLSDDPPHLTESWNLLWLSSSNHSARPLVQSLSLLCSPVTVSWLSCQLQILRKQIREIWLALLLVYRSSLLGPILLTDSSSNSFPLDWRQESARKKVRKKESDGFYGKSSTASVGKLGCLEDCRGCRGCTISHLP